MTRDELGDFLMSLSQAECIHSGMSACALAMDRLKSLSPNAHFDRMGNIIAPVAEPREDGEQILLDAHIDEIGFIVTSIDKEGFLRMGSVGGADLRMVQAQEVTVLGRERLFGVFCCRPPHLSTGEDRKKVPAADELAVDIGYDYETASRKVAPGDYVFLRRSPLLLPDGKITGKALDDRAGVAAVLYALELLKGESLPAGLTAVFSLGEELGERGARVSAFAVAPTVALVVDVSFGNAPDTPPERCGKVGKGPMIGISPTLSRQVTDGLFETARRCGIPYQTEVMPGDTGTNAAVISVSGEGVKAGMASIPLRNMHTAAEVVDVDDVMNTGLLLAEFVRNYGGAQNA